MHNNEHTKSKTVSQPIHEIAAAMKILIVLLILSAAVIATAALARPKTTAAEGHNNTATKPKSTAVAGPKSRASRPSANDVIRYHVTENVKIGYKIGSVLVDSDLSREHKPEVLNSLHLRFVSEPPISVTIGSRDGVIITSDVIDRDVIATCQRRDECEVGDKVTVNLLNYLTLSYLSINNNIA